MFDSGVSNESGGGDSRRAREERQELVTEAVRECLEKANGAQSEAARLLAERARTDESLYRAIIDQAVEIVCRSKIDSAVHSARAAIWAGSHDATGRGDRLLRVAGDRLMNFQLPGGKLLKDATVKDVRIAVEFYRKQAKNMNQKARWLDLIARRMKGVTKPVGEALTPKVLADLRKEAGDEK